jgi:hypothetical protein
MNTGIRRLAALLVVCIVAGASATAAFAYFNGFQTSLKGPGAGSAATLNGGSAVTAESHGTHVVLDWGASSLTTGDPADAYLVKRYDVATGTEQTMLSNCTGRITATTCNELNMPQGDWRYTVTPLEGANWRGAESAQSGDVVTGPTVMLLDRTVIGPPLPTQVTGTVTGLVPGEGLTYHLDDATSLSGSPANADANGNAAVTLTIPAGTSDGPHTVSVFGNDPIAPADADAAIVVDTTAPTLVPFTDPPANAAGWNNTSPVEVNATVDDGNGSGVAYAKYTDDGTDPTTSTTAKYATAPLSVSVTTTFKYILVDVAGNESPVATLQVKIDTMPPLFSVEFLMLSGHTYLSPASPEGAPGIAYYGGATAGSLKFNVIPTPMGGSPAISAGFSELTADTVGFTFDSSSITTPAGGPFVSNTLSWAAGTHSTPSGTITLFNAAGSSFGSAGALYDDSTAPTGGSVDATGLTGTDSRYSTSLNLSLNLAKGTDSESGLADGSVPADTPSRLMRASAPLSSANGVANGACGTYSAYVQVGSDNPASTVSNTVPNDATCYRFRYDVPDHVGNVAQYTSPDIKVKTVAATSLRPTDATITPVSGVSAQSVSGSTAYYNPALSGSFNVDSSASAPFVGVAQMSFPAPGGFTGGGIVTTPNSGTIFRNTYTWSANSASASPGAQALTATDNSGNTATNAAAFVLAKDDVAPSGGSVAATGLGGTGSRYSTSTTLSIALAPGTDVASGLATTGRKLLRASAALTSNGTADGNCGVFGAYTQVGADDPATPKSDTVPVDQRCYRYQYVVPDKVGNAATYTSLDIKVDAAAPPAPALTFSSLNNAYWSGSGTGVFYRPSAASGGFTVNASSADTTSGTSGYGFPTLPSGWSSASGGTGIRNYSWSPAGPTAPSGGQAVTATNNAGGQSSTTFTATPDSAAPSGGGVTYTNGYSTAATVSVAFTPGTDTGGSGLAAASGILQRASGTLINGVCGTIGAFTTAATNPTTPSANSVATGNCYQYRYLISDNVGNQATYTSASVVKVDTAAPTDTLSLSGAVGASLTSPATIYYKSNAVGSFNLTDSVADADSGPASATFPAIAATGWVHNAETISTPAGGPYASTAFSWTANPTNPVAKTVTGTDAAGLTTNTSVTFVSDITAPTGGSIAYTNGSYYTASVPITLVNGSDAGSGINTTVVKRDTTSMTAGVCGVFPGTFPTTVTLVGGADTSVSSGNCYQYRYVVTDKVGNAITYTSASVAKVDSTAYANAVLGTSGLVNYYRLGESTIARDNFSGTAGTLLQSHAGQTGATWAHSGTSQTDAVLTDTGSVRRNGVGAAMYSTSGTPPSADYSVSADFTTKSALDQDGIQVIGRVGSGDNYYAAGYTSNGAGTGKAELSKVVNGTATSLGSIATPFTVGQVYSIKLVMVGTTISMAVDGSVIASATDGSLTAAGKAGLRFGFAGATPSPTNTTGAQADNFAVTPPAADSMGTNPGDYFQDPTLSVAGAISGDSNTAAQFNGVNQYASAARQISNDFSIEFWFKSTQGSGLSSQWDGNAGMVDAAASGTARDFGVSLRSDGKVTAGTGNPDITITSTGTGYNNGAWHAVVFTRTRATGALALYVDGAAAGSATGGSVAALNAPPTINFGRSALNTNYFAGTLDEAALYGSVLSAATIADHYARR